MAEENQQQSNEYEPIVSDEDASEFFDSLGNNEEEKPQEELMTTEIEKSDEHEPAVETKDPGLFNFLWKKEVSEPEPQVEEEKKPGLLEKLHRSGSSSSKSVIVESMAEEHQRQSNECEPIVSDEDASEFFDLLGKNEEEKPQEEVMATEIEKSDEYEPAVETKDRGLFDFLGKKEVSEPEPQVEEEKKPGLLEKLHRSGSSSSKSSSDQEGDEGKEGEEKKKKKKEEKGLKEKLKEKISGEKEEEKHEETTVPVEQIDQLPHQEVANSEKKKGFLDKMKEKMLGQHKKADEAPPRPLTEIVIGDALSHQGQAGQDLANREEKKGLFNKIKQKLSLQRRKVHEIPLPLAGIATVDGEAKEKKGLLEKIKEKIPGYHPKTEEEKDREKISSGGDRLPLYHTKNEKKKQRERFALRTFLLRVYHPKTKEKKKRQGNLSSRYELEV